MPTTVEIPGVAELEFPDGMSQDDMLTRTREFYARHQQRRLTPDGPVKQAMPADLRLDGNETLRFQQEEAAREGDRAEAVANALSWADFLIRPFASTAENPLGGFGSAARPVGQAINAAGEVSKGVVRDVRLGATGSYPNTRAALSGTDMGPSPGGAIGEGLDDAGRMVPVVTGGMALQAAGVPAPAAFGGPMAAATLAETGDTYAAVTSGATGAVIPGVGQAGREAAAKVLGEAVRRGVMSGGAATTQKIAEAFVSQGGVQVFMEGLNLPAYLQMSPEERLHTLVRNGIANTAFAAADLPGIIRRTPSATQVAMGEQVLTTAKAGEVLEKLVNDPAAMEMIRGAVDEAARSALDPNALHARPKRVEQLVKAPPELQEVPAELVPAYGREVAVEEPTPMTPTANDPSIQRDPLKDGGRTDAGESQSGPIDARPYLINRALHSVQNKFIVRRIQSASPSERLAVAKKELLYAGMSAPGGKKPDGTYERGHGWSGTAKGLEIYVGDKKQLVPWSEVVQHALRIPIDAPEPATKSEPISSSSVVEPKPAETGAKVQKHLAEKSNELKAVLEAAGFTRGKGIAFVKRLAKEQGLRDWPKTRDVADYDALIDAVKKATAKPVSEAEAQRPPGVDEPAAETPPDPREQLRVSDWVKSPEVADEVQLTEAEKEARKFNPKAAREQKKYLLEELDDAIQAAPKGDRERVPDKFPQNANYQVEMKRITDANRAKFGTVVIEVPGDGTFEILNERGALMEFRDMAKRFPVSNPPSGDRPANLPKATNAGAVGDTSRENVIKAAQTHAGTDESRKGIYQAIWSDGERVVATDGRRMIIIEAAALGGSKEKIKIIDPKGKDIVQGTDRNERFPDWRPVNPDDSGWKHQFKDLDAGRLFNVVKQAETMTTDRHNAVKLYRNKDGTLGLTSGFEQGDGTYQHNVQPGARAVVALNPQYLMDALMSARHLGNQKVTLVADNELKPVVVRSMGVRSVIMPMRLDGPLQSPITKPPRGKGKSAYPEAAAPGGELGAGELGGNPPPADNPKFSVFDALPVELPEAVRFARDLLEGKYPRVREIIGALGGRAAGVFISSRGPNGQGRIEIKADAVRRHFEEFITKEDRARFKQEAEDYARATAEEGDNVDDIARERYDYLIKQAMELAKRQNPTWALKVMWHEIGHLVDWLPDKMINGRGNLFGRIASLKGYLKHTLPIDPNRPYGEPLTEKDRVKLRDDAMKQLRQELGPIEEIVETIMVEEPILRIVGITPEDVKNLFGMDAREKTPELYRWFAEQSAEVKKEIVKKAMRGVLDERLAALGKTEQVGTKRTEKTIRKKVGREPTQQELHERFRKLFREELERRNLAQLEAIKAELQPLIAWWRGTKTMEPYFKPSVEMYAEAFSVFMNNPAAVAQRAPQYYRLMHYHLEAKPEVKELYAQIQDQIRSGNVMGERVRELRSMWSRDDERSLKRWRDSFRTSARDFLDNVLYHGDRRFGPIFRAARKYPGQGRLRDAVGNFIYRASEHELFLNRVNRDVGRRLIGANLDWNDLGEYMFHQRIVNDRFALFNPQGWTSKNSIERLEEMQRQLGPERWATLVRAQEQFRAVYESEVIPLLREANMFTLETQSLIENAVWYATFAAVKDQPSLSIDRLIESSFGGTVGPQIYRQIGNLGEIKQPATATVLKALSLISAAHRNIAKRETVMMLARMEPGEIRPADTRWTGKRNEPIIRETDKVGTIVLMSGGKPQAFYVRKAIADALNYGNPIENRLLAAAASANAWMKGVFTQLNYAFWPVNFVRDTGSFLLNMPGLNTAGGWAKAFPRAVAAARASVTGRKANQYADAALRRRMLISRSDPRGVWSSVDNEFDLKVASFGLDPAQWDKQATKVNALVKLWQHYRETGQTFERVNKIAGMIYLDEKFPQMPEWKKREIVRERAGSPDFLQRGASNAGIDLIWMFYNPWKEGIRSTVKAAKENPFSFAAKFAGTVLIPSLVQAAASSGLLGEDLRKKYRSIPDYDLTNYYCVPLGWQDEAQGKVAYLRLPLPEPMRIGHGLLYKTLTNRGQGYGAFLGGQVPGLNPMFGTLAAWSEWGLFGHNPYDSFRGQPVLDETTFQSGGAAAAGELSKWTWNEMGGALVHRFQNTQLENPPQEEVEKFLRLPIVNNALGRWVKVSNRGIDDADRQLTAPIQKERAEIRLGVREVMRKLLDNEALTESERALMREPYALEYLLRTLPEIAAGRELPLMRRLNRAGSAEEKAAIIGAEPGR